MRLKVIACKVLCREISYLLAQCPHFIDVTYLRQGFHDQPATLRETLQAQIDAVEGGSDIHSSLKGGYDYDEKRTIYRDFDAIVLAYGFCSNSVSGLVSKRIPIVVPRVHDCISLFLGSHRRYKSYFDNHPGTYWYTSGWLENTVSPSKEAGSIRFKEYLEKYQESETAEYLCDIMNGWTDKYSGAAYIRMPVAGEDARIAYAKEQADFYGWDFEVLDGDLNLLKCLLWGEWDERFLVTEAGKSVSGWKE